ncbi:MAG TPA: prepilin-type N-terminal cleavage/methylation domain-containing protein [Chthoniobacterales bacterium]
MIPRARAGFALMELMIATAIFSSISAALLMGFVSLKRNYAATMDFAVNHADQMRISDYLAQDFRRAVAVNVAQNDVSIFIPTYYDSTPARNVQTPTLDGKGGVNYGDAGSTLKVRYYLFDSSIYRQEGTDPAVALASDVKDFVFSSTDLGKVIKTKITFRPTFRSAVASDDVAKSTVFCNTTLLRNNRVDTNTGVY